MNNKSQIFIPEELSEKRNEILSYYNNEYTFEQCKQFIYGGKSLTILFNEINIDIVNKNKLTVQISFKGDYHKKLIINEFSFKQLTLESSNNFLANPKIGWKNLTSQQRVEICQHELSRWSLVLKENWITQGNININNDEEFSHLELINNCTTSEGFEFKLIYNNILYHGSFKMPSKIYNLLCNLQAGSYAKQGWNVDWNRKKLNKDSDHGLLDPTTYPHKDLNPTFGQIYWEENTHSRKTVKIDLNVYRTVLSEFKSGNIEVNLGEINYNRWNHAIGKGNEYFAKPNIRKLIGKEFKNEYQEPPVTYNEIYDGSYRFRLPLFLENGLYDVTSLKEKNHYSILKKLTTYKIVELQSGFHEITLINENALNDELHKIVIGNINLNEIPKYPNILTIDRFCFSPRPTKLYYSENWIPASLKNKQQTIYSFLLSRNNTFIQPESWGIERALLSMNNANITIDLMSYERILPVWQGELKIKRNII